MKGKRDMDSDIADRNWWRRVGKLIGSRLHGWSYRNSASFVEPLADISGKVATLLLDQQAEIERLHIRIFDLTNHN